MLFNIWLSGLSIGSEKPEIYILFWLIDEWWMLNSYIVWGWAQVLKKEKQYLIVFHILTDRGSPECGCQVTNRARARGERLQLRGSLLRERHLPSRLGAARSSARTSDLQRYAHRCWNAGETANTLFYPLSLLEFICTFLYRSKIK